MFSDEELALIAAIHADPKNDAPRLAYADWLEKDGEHLHAEFIRLQCQTPYIAISSRDPDSPRLSFSFAFPHDDPTARARLARMLEIFPAIYRADRYAAQRKLPYYEEHYRGLPLIQVGDDDELDIEEWELKEMGHLSRVDLSIRTENLAELLSHPITVRVDKLHIWPHIPWDTEPDADATMNSHYDTFWAENIPVLAASPLINRLVELNPCGCHSTGELTKQSRKNLALCEELLEPRVYVEYSY
jgi:uncharacterized protein (TIGR02996 family)